MNKDYYNFMKWNDLTMKQRAEVINLAVKNGIKDLDSIKSFYNDHTYEIGGFTQALQSYTEPETVEAAAAKLALQLADPTGISSYPDVAAAYNDFTSSPSLKSLGNLALETVGALPLIGKVSTPFKAARTAKLLKRIGEAGKVANVAENVRAANKAVDTLPELIPGVRRIAEKTQDFTTRTIVDPLFKKYASANKLDKVRDFRNANIGIDLVNGANTTSDITAGTREIYNASSEKALGGPLVEDFYAYGGEIVNEETTNNRPQDEAEIAWMKNWLSQRKNILAKNADKTSWGYQKYEPKRNTGDVREAGWKYKYYGNLLNPFVYFKGYTPTENRVNKLIYAQIENAANTPKVNIGGGSSLDYNTRGVYVPPNYWDNSGHYVAFAGQEVAPEVKIHEFTHASHPAPQEIYINDIIFEGNTPQVVPNHKRSSMDNAKELYGALQEFRFKNGLKPEQIIDQKYIDTHRDLFKNNYLENVSDENKLRLFNEVALKNVRTLDNMAAYGGPMGTYYDGWGDIRNWLITKAKRRK